MSKQAVTKGYKGINIGERNFSWKRTGKVASGIIFSPIKTVFNPFGLKEKTFIYKILQPDYKKITVSEAAQSLAYLQSQIDKTLPGGKKHSNLIKIRNRIYSKFATNSSGNPLAGQDYIDAIKGLNALVEAKRTKKKLGKWYRKLGRTFSTSLSSQANQLKLKELANKKEFIKQYLTKNKLSNNNQITAEKYGIQKGTNLDALRARLQNHKNSKKQAALDSLIQRFMSNPLKMNQISLITNKTLLSTLQNKVLQYPEDTTQKKLLELIKNQIEKVSESNKLTFSPAKQAKIQELINDKKPAELVKYINENIEIAKLSQTDLNILVKKLNVIKPKDSDISRLLSQMRLESFNKMKTANNLKEKADAKEAVDYFLKTKGEYSDFISGLKGKKLELEDFQMIMKGAENFDLKTEKLSEIKVLGKTRLQEMYYKLKDKQQKKELVIDFVKLGIFPEKSILVEVLKNSDGEFKLNDEKHLFEINYDKNPTFILENLKKIQSADTLIEALKNQNYNPNISEA